MTPLTIDSVELAVGNDVGTNVNVFTQTLSVDPTDYQYLAAGEIEEIAYTYNVSSRTERPTAIGPTPGGRGPRCSDGHERHGLSVANVNPAIQASRS